MLHTDMLGLFKGQRHAPEQLHFFPAKAVMQPWASLSCKIQRTIFSHDEPGNNTLFSVENLPRKFILTLRCFWSRINVKTVLGHSLFKKKKKSFVRNFHYLNCLIRVLTFLTSYSLAVERALVSLFQLEQTEGPVAWGHFHNKPCPQELEKNNSFLLKSCKTIFSY